MTPPLRLETTAPYDLRWQADTPPTHRNPDHVVVRPLLVGTCGTDLEIVRGSYPRVSFPAVLGHEWVGQVEHGGGHFAEGTVVVGYNQITAADGTIVELGFEVPGAMSSRIVVPSENVVPAPTGAAAIDLVLAEPTSVAIHAASRVPPAARRVVVIGDGPIGLISALVLRHRGHLVTLIGAQQPRLEHIKRLGFRCQHAKAINLDNDPPYDAVLEASGSPAAADLALSLTVEYGLVVLVGAYLGHPLTAFGLIADRNLTVSGVNTGAGFLPAAVDLIASAVVTSDLLGVTFVSPAEAPTAISDLARGDRSDLKLILDLRG